MPNDPSGNNQLKISKTIKIIIILILIIAAVGLAIIINALTTPYSSAIRHDIVDGNITLKSGSYEYYNFTVPPNNNAQIRGNFSVCNDSTIEVLIMDEANFARWQSKQNANTFYSSGEQTAANVTATLRSQGTYYIVFDNSFGSAEKNVQTSINEYVYWAQLFR